MTRTLVAFILLWAAVPTYAGAQWPPDSLTNLKVLPRDITVREIVGVMRGFASGLGVRCIHCHVGDDPNDLGSTDFVSDDRVQKRKAREMIKMVNQINRNLLANVPERSDPPIEVTCATCHHGVTKPLDIRVILAAVATEHGADSAIAQYEAMREEYYGAASYDFRPFMLANVAERIAPEAFDVAMAIAEYNTERYPANDQTYLTMAQMHMARSDTAAAIRALERGIEQNPDNEFFPGLVRRLGGGR